MEITRSREAARLDSRRRIPLYTGIVRLAVSAAEAPLCAKVLHDTADRNVELLSELKGEHRERIADLIAIYRAQAELLTMPAEGEGPLTLVDEAQLAFYAIHTGMYRQASAVRVQFFDSYNNHDVA